MCLCGHLVPFPRETHRGSKTPWCPHKCTIGGGEFFFVKLPDKVLCVLCPKSRAERQALIRPLDVAFGPFRFRFDLTIFRILETRYVRSVKVRAKPSWYHTTRAQDEATWEVQAILVSGHTF